MVPRRILYGLLIVALLFGGSQVIPTGIMRAQAAAHGAAHGAALGSGQTQAGEEKQFDNGFTVSGEFLTFYRSVDDPDRLFGNPITIEFDDPTRPGFRMQYFERV